MTKTQLVAAAVCGAALMSLADAASANVSYSFTSGPSYDGFDWPQYQRSSQAPGGGLRGGPFNTPDGVTFYNFSGNLAFFDANNLTTRPAQYIQNEAWWTDVKLASYQSSSGQAFTTAAFDISFNNTPDGAVQTFGFDAAMVTIGSTTPQHLTYFISDTAGRSAFGAMQFTETFSSLSGAGTGREGQFTFRAQDFFDDDAGDDGGEFLEDIESIYISLRDLASPAGLSQFAIDNVWTGVRTSYTPRREPNLYLPLDQIPENTPHTFVYASETDGENQTAIDPSAFGDPNDVLQAKISSIDPTNTTADNLGARSYSTGTSVFVTTGTVDSGLHAHEVTHTQSSGGDPNVRVEVESESDAYTQAVSTQTVLGSEQRGEGEQFFDLTSEQGQQVYDVGDEPAGSIHSTYEDAGDGASQLQMFDDLSLATFNVELESQASYYLGYSFEQYLAMKDAEDAPWTVGDNGATVRPLFADDGQIITYLLDTWIVTDSSGTMSYTIVPIPEPATVALLIAAAPMLLRRRPRR